MTDLDDRLTRYLVTALFAVGLTMIVTAWAWNDPADTSYVNPPPTGREFLDGPQRRRQGALTAEERKG